MLKSNILNLLLAIIVIALATVIYFSEEESFELDRITNTDLNSINKITIKHNSNTTSLIKQDNNWQITQPTNIAANTFRINSLLKLLNAPIHNQYELSDFDTRLFKQELGFKEHSTTIQFKNDSETYSFAFGTVNPVTNLRYIKFNRSIYTIEDVYFPLISSHFGTLVSFNLLPTEGKIEKMIFDNHIVSKNDNGLWESNITINGDDIIQIINNWKNTQAFGVHEYLKREQLSKISVFLENQNDTINFLVTDNDPWLIIARPDINLEYHFDIEAYKKLIPPL